MAVEVGIKDTVDFLVKEGADINIKDNAGASIVMKLFLADQWPDGKIREVIWAISLGLCGCKLICKQTSHQLTSLFVP